MKFVVNFNSQRIAKRLFITYLSFNYSLLLGLRFLLERERRLSDICLRDFVVISDLFFSLILLTLVSARFCILFIFLSDSVPISFLI